MGILEIIFLALWVACIVFDLFVRPTFIKFIIAAIGDTVLLGIAYVIIHLVIKNW